MVGVFDRKTIASNFLWKTSSDIDEDIWWVWKSIMSWFYLVLKRRDMVKWDLHQIHNNFKQSSFTASEIKPVSFAILKLILS